MNLNDSNQLYPQLDQVAKVLPLTWAAKLCERVFEYVRYEDIAALKEIKRPKKPTTDEIPKEDDAVKAVKKWFKHGGAKEGRIWSENLDGSMFYL